MNSTDGSGCCTSAVATGASAVAVLTGSSSPSNIVERSLHRAPDARRAAPKDGPRARVANGPSVLRGDPRQHAVRPLLPELQADLRQVLRLRAVLIARLAL